MKRIVCIFLILAVLFFPASAQQPAPAKTEVPVAVTPEQQQAFAEAIKDAELKQAQADAAKARAQTELLRVYAKLKLDPDEYDARLIEGRLVFVKKEKK